MENEVTRPHTPHPKMAAILVFFGLLANSPLMPRLKETFF